MIILDCIQGSPEWFEARRGRPTTSQFSRVVSPTGLLSKQLSDYAFDLVIEKHSQEKIETYEDFWTKRGKRLEPKARILYEFLNDADVHQVGFCFLDKKKQVGGSPDGLCEQNGGLEIKSPKAKTHLNTLDSGIMPQEHIPQVQGCMWVCEREWWDFFSYHPDFNPFQIRIYRDEKYIGLLKAGIKMLYDEIAKIEKRIL